MVSIGCSMDNLKQCSLNELIDRVVREALIDSCERRGDYVLIVQGTMRFVLSPTRAHAFLRGVIKGMSMRERDESMRAEKEVDISDVKEANDAQMDEQHPNLMNSFRKHLLKKWWMRYQRAGCPLGRTKSALVLWVQHGTSTTVN